jgi:hypothetical protein
MKLFPESDPKCTDPNRIFYGGKELHNCQFDNRVNPFALFDTYLKKLESKSPSNFARARTTFLNGIGVSTSESEFGIKYFDEFTLQNEEILVSTLIYKELTKNSSFSKVIHGKSIYSIHWVPKIDKKNERQLQDRKPSWVEIEPKEGRRLDDADVLALESGCQLFREFRKGERRLTNPERFLLVTNLYHLRNGVAIYRQGLTHFEDSSDPYPPKDSELIGNIQRYMYPPQNCIHCPYARECERPTNILQLIRLRKNECRKIEEVQNAKSLPEVRNDLRIALESLLIERAHVKDLSIVRADCGVGKTQVLLELLPRMNHVCIAFPTHRLAKEAYERFVSMTNCQSYFLWPERPKLPTDLQVELEKNESIGVSKTRELYEAALEHEDVLSDSSWMSDISQFLAAYTQIFHQTRIFCTHEKAVQLISKDTGLISTFVFDEDPMKSLFKIDQIHLEDVKTVIERVAESDASMPEVVECLENVLSAEPNTLVIPKDFTYGRIAFNELIQGAGISSPVGSLLDCTGFIKPQLEIGRPLKDVACISHRPLDEKYKYVIASATPILPLYQKAYGNRVDFLDTSPVELMGKLYLHRDRSFSKSSVLEMGKDFAPAVEGFVEEYQLDGIITHKDFVKTVDSKVALKGSKGQVQVVSTFGATEGFNGAAGKRIGVVGTPHWPEHALKLLAHAVGVPIHGIQWDFDCRTVRRHEFEVSLYCVSDDEFVQSIEFGLVERELIQSVGRARLLENDCEVHLWSNYVLSGGDCGGKS